MGDARATNVPIDVARQIGNGGKVVEPADEHGADDAGRALGRQQRGQLRAGVLAEQHQLIGVDSELGGSGIE